MLKIIFIVKYYYPLKRPSGILRFVMNLSEKLGEKTHLTIITCKFNKTHKNKEHYQNYDIIRVNSPFYVFSAIESTKLRPDLIIFGTGISKLWLLLAISIIFRSINILFSYLFNFKKSRYLLYQFVDLNYKNQFLAKYICALFEKVICTNRTLFYFYSKYNKKETTFYLPPGVDLLKFDNIKNRINEKIRIGFFGHLSYNKGPDILLNSFLKLNNNNIELFIAGLGDLDGRLKRTSLKHKNIFIKGYMDNIEEAILSCDLLVFPYRYSEMILGLSLSAIEGLAIGKPLLVSNSNCLRDLVNHDENGYIFNNEDDLTRYLLELTENKNKLIAFGLKSKDKSSEFNINFIRDKLINVISKSKSKEIN